MKMKKFFKKLMTVALAATLLSVGAGVEKAEAANYCPHYVDAREDVLMNVREGGYLHQVQLYDIKYDEDGNEYLVPDGYINCAVTVLDEEWIIRCGICRQQIGAYTRRRWPIHSNIYCAVG